MQKSADASAAHVRWEEASTTPKNSGASCANPMVTRCEPLEKQNTRRLHQQQAGPPSLPPDRRGATAGVTVYSPGKHVAVPCVSTMLHPFQRVSEGRKRLSQLTGKEAPREPSTLLPSGPSPHVKGQRPTTTPAQSQPFIVSPRARCQAQPVGPCEEPPDIYGNVHRSAGRHLLSRQSGLRHHLLQQRMRKPVEGGL